MNRVKYKNKVATKDKDFHIQGRISVKIKPRKLL